MRTWIEKELRKRWNKPVSTADPLLRLEVSFRDEAEASLGEQVLARNAAVVHRRERSVVALVRRPSEASSHADAAKRIAQPLLEAHLDVVTGTLHPPLSSTDAADRKTWHTMGLSEGFAASAAESGVIRSSPARLLAPGFQEVSGTTGPGSTGGRYPRLRWVDVPEVALLPWPTWLLFIALFALFISADVDLAGTGRWTSTIVVIMALAAIGATLFLALPWEWPGSGKRLVSCVVGILVAYGGGALVSRAAPGPVYWGPFLFGVGIAVGYAIAASWVIGWLRRQFFAGSTLLGIGSSIIAVVGASAWAQQLLVRTFQDGLGFTQTPLAIRPLDLLLRSGGTGLLALGGIAVLVVGILVLWNQLQDKRNGSRVQVVLLAPIIVVMAATLIAPLFVTVYSIGREIQVGDLSQAHGIAACVQLGTTTEQSGPLEVQKGSVLVGPVTGPALSIDTSSDGPAMTALPGGVTAKLVPDGQCSAAR